RGEKRGLVDLARRNAALAYQTRFNQTTSAQYDALETLQAVLALPTLPRRIECFDISTIQGSETVASMVVCEDGRMRRGEYRKFRIRGSGFFATRGSGGGAPGLGAVIAGVLSDAERGGAKASASGGEAPLPSSSGSYAERGGAKASASGGGAPREVNNDFAAMQEVVLRRYRKLLEQGGPFPDVILIDGGKGQL